MSQTQTAVFAGGCFWGVEHLFLGVEGVKELQVGYTGGNVPHPSYEQVCTHTTGHAEAVRIVFDPQIVSFETLAKLFLKYTTLPNLTARGPISARSIARPCFTLHRNSGKRPCI